MPDAQRPYRGPADLQAMIALVSRRPPERLTAYPFLVDLLEITGTPGGRASIQVWERPGGELAAFGLLDGGFLAFEIAPEAAFSETATQILAWASRQAPAGGELSANCRERDLQRRELLEGHGFQAQVEHTLHFLRDLALPIPRAALPDGFVIRPLRGEAEVEEWVALHRAAHGTEWMTGDFRRAMMSAPGYRPGLDLVAVAPGGRLAAYVLGHFSEEENRLRGQAVGFTDPVATHPDFQGKGLARALLLECFRWLKGAGMDFAEVGTSSDNLAMIRAAESVGYRAYTRTIFYRKPVRAQQV